MKSDQRLRYAEKIERVVRHIQELPEAATTPRLADLAAVAAMSEFHFHRVFRIMTGETVAEMLRRVRLARTLPALATDAKVTAAAQASGYSSAQAYARALRRGTGTSASSARRRAGGVESLAETLRARPIGEDVRLPPLGIEIVSVDPFRLLAIRNVGDYAELNAGFSRLFDRVLSQMPPEALQGIYGVPIDDLDHDPADTFRFDCALAVGDTGIPEGDLTELRLGGGEHGRLRHVGSYDAIGRAIDQLYAKVIDGMDREIAPAPLFIHYRDDPEEVDEAQLTADIFLPLV